MLSVYDSNSINFGSLNFSADVSESDYSTLFLARDPAHPGDSYGAYAAGISFRAGSDSVVQIQGKKLVVESIYGKYPANSDRTSFIQHSEPIGAVVELSKTDLSLSTGTQTWNNLTSGYIQVGVGTWIVFLTVSFAGASSGKAAAMLRSSADGAYSTSFTSHTYGSPIQPVASSTTRVQAFAVLKVPSGVQQIWAAVYSTVSENVSAYYIKAVHIF